MIPKEFKKTIEHIKKYDSHMTQFDYEEISEELEHLPSIEFQRKEYEASPEYKLEELTKQSFSDEYVQLTEDKSYFLGCTYNSYSLTYKSRLKAFKDLYIDAEEHHFIIEELNLIRSYNFSYFIEDKLKKSIRYSLEKTNYSLKEGLKSLGYTIKNTVTEEGEINSIAIKDASVIKLDTEISVDLSDTEDIDKIRILGLIGFFKYIIDREPNLNNNQIASVISSFTGIKQNTVYPYINPFFKKDIDQKKNPFNNKGKVAKAKRDLINIGVSNIENL
jgi:hypothetical protein